jgi:hypothetical protein
MSLESIQPSVEVLARRPLAVLRELALGRADPASSSS